MCTGYLSETVEKIIEEFNIKNPDLFDFHYSHETSPLGSGGALLNAYPNLSKLNTLILVFLINFLINVPPIKPEPPVIRILFK